MDELSQSRRLDQILLDDGLVTEDQLKHALAHQREHGGKLGSLLLRYGFVDESGIVTALARRHHCAGVVLGERTIDQSTLATIPAEVATARNVLPFQYDASDNVLKVACEDPNDEALIEELSFIAGGKKPKLFIAAEMVLKAAISRHYGKGGDSEEITDAEKSREEIVRTLIADMPDAPVDNPSESYQGSVLLVNDDTEEAERLTQLLRQQNYQVTCLDSADDAIQRIKRSIFDAVFIKDTVPGDYIDLIDRLRKLSPRTKVRYYEAAADLLVEEDQKSIESELFVKNLDLFTSLLVQGSESVTSRATAVGQLVDQLCRELGLPVRERLLITNVGYVHDLSKYYYGPQEVPDDPRAQIDLTVKLLDSVGYPPVALEILRSMYINLRGKYTRRLPIEVLGGNIVTIVDIFCDNIDIKQKISLDKFEAVRKKISDLTGKLFLSEVAGAFLNMVQRDILKTQKQLRYGQVMIYGKNEESVGRVGRQLSHEGFHAITETDYQVFVELFNRSVPNMIVLLGEGQSTNTVSLVEDLIARGVDVAAIPTFVLAGTSEAASLTGLFERGIEDIIVLDESLEFLKVKLKKVHARIEDRAQRDEPSTDGLSRGSLADMNLIDLLQALGPSQKTVRLTITSSDGTPLLLYLDRGQISFAECGDKRGAEAVFVAIGWNDGSWVIQPIESEELPEPNNELPNESILMEGCRQLDESQRIPKPSE